MTERRWVLLAACALFVLGALVGWLARGGGTHISRSELEAARGQNAALAARLRRVQARDRRALREANRAAGAASAYTRVMQRELLGAQGGHSPIGFCSSHDFPSVEIKILAPAEGAVVASPLVAHLVVSRPLGCYAEYYVTVDGNLYRPVQDFRRVAPVVSAQHPQVARRVPGKSATTPEGACFGGVWEYIRFQLPPGDHVLAVSGGCSQGTEVPKATSAPVRFSVTGA